MRAAVEALHPGHSIVTSAVLKGVLLPPDEDEEGQETVSDRLGAAEGWVVKPVDDEEERAAQTIICCLMSYFGLPFICSHCCHIYPHLICTAYARKSSLSSKPHCYPLLHCRALYHLKLQVLLSTFDPTSSPAPLVILTLAGVAIDYTTAEPAAAEGEGALVIVIGKEALGLLLFFSHSASQPSSSVDLPRSLCSAIFPLLCSLTPALSLLLRCRSSVCACSPHSPLHFPSVFYVCVQAPSAPPARSGGRGTTSAPCGSMPRR